MTTEAPAATPLEVGRAFFDALDAHDLDTALSLSTFDAPFEVPPASVSGTVGVEGRAFLGALLDAFPDLTVQVRGAFAGRDGCVVAEVKIEGTQSGEFLGIINQEKHLDLEGAWLIRVGTEGRICGARVYWCQNQLYRRLAVKRLDEITITG